MRRFLFCFLGAVLAAQAEPSLAGVWQGDINGLPGVEITIHEAKGIVDGTTGFYFQVRENGRWQVKEKYSTPMLKPKLVGKAVSFEVIHHKSHGSTELGPNKRYEIELISSNEARLREVMKDKAGNAGEGLLLKKLGQASFAAEARE